MDDNTIIFPKHQITVAQVKRIAKIATSKTDAARKMDISYNVFRREIEKFGLLHLFKLNPPRKRGPLSEVADKVLHIMKRDRQISARQIKELMQSDYVPSRAIHLLRSRGHNIISTHTDPENGIVWSYRGRITNHNYHPERKTFSLVERKVPCMACGTDVTIHVRENHYYDKRRLCSDCKNREEPRIGTNAKGQARKLTRIANGHKSKVVVKVYYPGTEEFEHIAPEITHVSKIKDTKMSDMPEWGN